MTVVIFSTRSEKEKFKHSESAVTVEALGDADQPQRVRRVKVLSEQQKKAIRGMQSAADIPHEERKRQWGALKRRLEQKNLPDGVLKKWESATSRQDKFFPQQCTANTFVHFYLPLPVALHSLT